ncbi:MAG: TIGR04255 family protein [Acidimicrobiales bacterium]
MALAFPAPADQVFRDAPLVVVLSQVKFPAVLSLLAEPGAAGFQEAIRDTYPAMAKVEGAGLVVGPTTMEARREAPVWKFTSSDEQWVVSLSVDFVALEALKYTHAGDFLGRLDRVLDAVDRTIHPAPSTRVGLRKVNQITAEVDNPRAWSRYLKPALVGLLGDGALPGGVRGALSVLRLRDENGDDLIVQHGLMDDDDAQKYRIDLDYSTERPFEIRANDGLTALLRSYAASETQFFMWSLGEDLYRRYGPIPRPMEQESQ